MLGLETIALFYFFGWAVWSDHATGTIPIYVLLIPTGLLFYWMPAAFWGVFFYCFLSFLAIWGILKALQSRKLLDPQKTYLGMGDVLGIPLALGIVQAAFPILGMMVFAVVLAVEMPIFIRKKFARLLPWLFLPTVLAILPRLFF
jgi:hypothetical protein